jgi:hypothetical protein
LIAHVIRQPLGQVVTDDEIDRLLRQAAEMEEPSTSSQHLGLLDPAEVEVGRLP